MTALYRRAHSNHCTWLRYDDSDCWIVHSPASGQTHLLTDSAHRLWTLVPEHGGCSARDLIDRLHTELGLPEEALAETVDDTLATVSVSSVTEVTPRLFSHSGRNFSTASYTLPELVPAICSCVITSREPPAP